MCARTASGPAGPVFVRVACLCVTNDTLHCSGGAFGLFVNERSGVRRRMRPLALTERHAQRPGRLYKQRDDDDGSSGGGDRDQYVHAANPHDDCLTGPIRLPKVALAAC